MQYNLYSVEKERREPKPEPGAKRPLGARANIAQHVDWAMQAGSLISRTVYDLPHVPFKMFRFFAVLCYNTLICRATFKKNKQRKNNKKNMTREIAVEHCKITQVMLECSVFQVLLPK